MARGCRWAMADEAWLAAVPALLAAPVLLVRMPRDVLPGLPEVAVEVLSAVALLDGLPLVPLFEPLGLPDESALARAWL